MQTLGKYIAVGYDNEIRGSRGQRKGRGKAWVYNIVRLSIWRDKLLCSSSACLFVWLPECEVNIFSYEHMYECVFMYMCEFIFVGHALV